MSDVINHPSHYEKHLMVLQPLQIMEEAPACMMNAIKYALRAKDKGKELEDLQKAYFYTKRVIDFGCTNKNGEFDKWCHILSLFRFSDVKLVAELGDSLFNLYGVLSWTLFLETLEENIKSMGGEVDESDYDDQCYQLRQRVIEALGYGDKQEDRAEPAGQ